MKEGMKEKLVDVAHKFLSNEIDVHSFFCELEELNRNGIWSCLDSRERETISRYLMIYYDGYAGGSIQNHGFWRKLVRKIKNEPAVDLKEVREGTKKLLENLHWDKPMSPATQNDVC